MSITEYALSSIPKKPVNWESQLGHVPVDPILIYLTVDGVVTPIRVLESDSIASVKMRIQTCKGFVVKNQKLVYSGRELARNDTLIKDYGVTDGNVLHLVLRLSDLLFIVVKTVSGKEFRFHIDGHRNVGYLKQRIKNKGEEGLVDFDDQDIFCNNEKLDDQRLFHELCKNDGNVIHLIIKKSAKIRTTPVCKDLKLLVEAGEFKQAEEQTIEVPKIPAGVSFWLEPVIVNPKMDLFPYLWDLINTTYEGLKRGNSPIRSLEGTGGTYLMQDSTGHQYVSVFKPMDEEPMAVNNPRGLPCSSNNEGLKRGTKVGEGALREVAAYILDHPRNGSRLTTGEAIGFAGVPPTVIVQCLHKEFHHPNGFACSLKHVKIGSLQKFMTNDGNCEDIGPRAFPVEEVHKITVLDIRLANTDRHAGNILIRKEADGQIKLIPIDHGYCLPAKFEDCTFDWLYWPQARQPYSPDAIEYINSLDAEKDIELLKYYGWDMPIEYARTLRISTMLLKKGVQRGLTPFDIGSIMCRENLNKESVIEETIRQAQDSLLPGMDESAFLKTISEIMDSRLEKLANH
ncbi:phosphatidylinositol 4-kinase gamma 4-like [Arachis stenosperma]|uniref:phosphatidylinositol 4-kinase gamma 4-like n=1 Tax=Arachis stenosperma TaxID=217475 RepID=UPI0025ABE1AE|nr:phosphatidylinositol 4-kinase gamma 4-like [Arachis stenosperma]